MATSELRRLRVEQLRDEWALTGAEHSPRSFLMHVKGFSEGQYERTIATVPTVDWYARRREVQEQITYSLVKAHIDFVTEMNDTHIKAAKLGLAKAIDIMTRLKIEERRDKNGNVYFAGFSPTDLVRCMEVVKSAQHIQRRALGLPNESGSLAAWEKVQHERRDSIVVSAADGSVVKKRETTIDARDAATERVLSLDDIRAIIAFERAMRRQDALSEGRGGETQVLFA